MVGGEWKKEKLSLKFSQGNTLNTNLVLDSLKLKNAGNGQSEEVSNQITRIETRKKLCYTPDTLPGSSGSPVMCVIKNREDEDESCVVAIHNGGLNPGILKHGDRIVKL